MFHLRNHSIAPVHQLLITLRFLATGGHLLTIGDEHGVSVPTVSRIIKKVCRAIIIKLMLNFIKMPAANEVQGLQAKFYNIAQFPFVIGTIDCTHVKIQSPGKYIYFSIVKYNTIGRLFGKRMCLR